MSIFCIDNLQNVDYNIKKFKFKGEKMIKITLTSARENAGLSIEEVAEILHKSKGTISNWEKGRTSMKIDDFIELCNLYKISNDYVMLP